MFRMKHIFIVNPAAGKRDATEYVTEKVKLSGIENYEIYRTKAPGDATVYIKNLLNMDTSLENFEGYVDTLRKHIIVDQAKELNFDLNKEYKVDEAINHIKERSIERKQDCSYYAKNINFSKKNQLKNNDFSQIRHTIFVYIAQKLHFLKCLALLKHIFYTHLEYFLINQLYHFLLY